MPELLLLAYARASSIVNSAGISISLQNAASGGKTTAVRLA